MYVQDTFTTCVRNVPEEKGKQMIRERRYVKLPRDVEQYKSGNRERRKPHQNSDGFH